MPTSASSRPLKYNPKPPTVQYRLAVFNPKGYGVAEFATTVGQNIDQRKAAAQELADQLQEGYTLAVYDTVYRIGETRPGSRVIQWT